MNVLRRQRSIATLCFTLFATGPFALPSTLHAQTSASTQAAQASFQRGIAEMDAHRYQAALIALEESFQLYPSPVATYNIALAHRELGHTRQAIATFERYLSEGGARLPPARIATVRDVIRQLREQLATVRFQVSPTPFTVTLDARDVTLSDGALTVDPGDHVLVVTAVGHRAWREELHLAPGQQSSQNLTLVPDGVASPRAFSATTPPAITTPTPHPREEQRSTSVTSRWWFWTGLGVLVAGGVVTGIVIANQNATLDPLVPGTAFNVQTIRTP